MAGPAIVWFRKDLRCDDNPALIQALTSGSPVLPLFIWSPDEEKPWPPGGASRWWLHHALIDLRQQLKDTGLELAIAQGPAESLLPELAKKVDASAVYWNRRYEGHIVQRDARIKENLIQSGIKAQSFNASLLFEPWTVQSGSGTSYKVYTPFRKNIDLRPVDKPVAVPQSLQAREPYSVEKALSTVPGTAGLSVEALKLLPTRSWDAGFYKFWQPQRSAVLKTLKDFLSTGVEDYHEQRDIPSINGTSRLSPFLHWGQIGPREIMALLADCPASSGAEHFRRELLWREFGYHVLFHYPRTATQPLQTKFNEFPWQSDPAILAAWQQGRTGYPIVDAGMRQLWQTGWMHNRVRMVVASFLVKHLLHSWQEGAAWFWDTLVDADLASNTLGWQWAGGCGADAAPYFRIFNPMTQGKKFDPEGSYVKQYIPELAKLPAKFVHEPWLAPENILQYAGIRYGETYPKRIIEHETGRQRALQALEQIKD